MYLLHLMMLETTLAGLFYLLSLYRPVFLIVFPISFFIGSGFAFWSYTQDITVTTPLLQAILESKPDIAIDLITLPFVMYMAVVCAVIYLVIKFYQKINPKKGWFFFLPLAILCFSIFHIVEGNRHGTLKNRLPYSIYYGLKEYYEIPNLVLNEEVAPITFKEDSLQVVFVLGETVRADHLGINGYHRNTTPLLGQATNLISLNKLYTAHTYTAASVPQLLTDAKFDEKPRPYTSLYSVAKKAHFKTVWIGNQVLEKAYEPVVKTNDTILIVDQYRSVFSFAKKRDEVMLPILDSVLQQGHRSLTTVHMIGSHWYYENRYEDAHRKYLPVVSSKYIPSVTKEEMINSYDNTLLYLDSFLDQVIKTLQKPERPAVMIYISDHGELLGESGTFLHAQEGGALHYPAGLIWFSDDYARKYPKTVEHFEHLEVHNDLTTEIVFPSLMQLLQILVHDPANVRKD